MSNRLLIGNKSGVGNGMFVSKPGQDVLTVDEANLLFSSGNGFSQFIQTGTVTITKTSFTTLNIPNLGYNPVILFYNPIYYDDINGSSLNRERRVIVRYPVYNQISLIIASNSNDKDLIYNSAFGETYYTASLTTVYGVTRLNADG